MLETDYKVHSEYDGLFVSHPYINSTVQWDDAGFYDIRKYPERYARYREQLKQRILGCFGTKDYAYYVDANDLRFKG
jgi:hypothetical protein